MIYEVRALTGKTEYDAIDILLKLAKWARTNRYSIEQAFNLWKQDIMKYGEPNLTAEAFTEDFSY